MTFEYSVLREASNQVLEFTKNYVGDEDINLRTSIAEDLSLWELDGYIFLDDFQEKFGIKLPDDAYDYVCPPVLKLRFLEKLSFAILFVVAFPLIMLRALFIQNDPPEILGKKIKRNRKRLTLGDLVMTLVVGKFVKRENLKIELKK